MRRLGDRLELERTGEARVRCVAWVLGMRAQARPGENEQSFS